MSPWTMNECELNGGNEEHQTADDEKCGVTQNSVVDSNDIPLLHEQL